jgi:hypothetical protein
VTAAALVVIGALAWIVIDPTQQLLLLSSDTKDS